MRLLLAARSHRVPAPKPRRGQLIEHGRELDVDRDHVARCVELGLELLEAVAQIGEFHVAAVGRLTSAPVTRALEDSGFVLRAPVRQMRDVVL